MKFSDIAKRMIKTITIITIICILASVIYYRSLEFLPFLIGAILGSVTSIFRVYLLDRSVDKALTMENKNASNYIIIQNILRFLLSGAVLVLGALVPQISLWGVAAGILAFPLAAYGENFKTK